MLEETPFFSKEALGYLSGPYYLGFIDNYYLNYYNCRNATPFRGSSNESLIELQLEKGASAMKKAAIIPYLILFILPLVIGLSACGAIPPRSNGSGNTPGLPVTGGTPSVTVKDQTTDGTSVVVEDVVSQGPGWMVIHAQANGTVGEAIGETHLDNGDNKNVVVKIDSTKATSTMYAMLHTDAGIVGKYEFPGPDVPVMSSGLMLSPAFHATIQAAAGSATATPDMAMSMGTATPAGNYGGTASTTNTPSVSGGAAKPAVLQPSVTVKDQQIVNGTVTIPQVVANGNWWLVIHRQDSNGQMGEYIGQTLVKNGVNTNVVVKINTNLATPVLYAMLHYDNPPIGILQFPGSDTPVYLNGQMIAPSFHIGSQGQDITINIHKVSDTVSFLTDTNGKSLYISLNDKAGQSNCDAACQQVWSPLLAGGKVLAGQGVDQTKLGILLRPDGTKQVTYLNAPLYTYTKDVNPGDTTGQGVDGVWFLVTP